MFFVPVALAYLFHNSHTQQRCLRAHTSAAEVHAIGCGCADYEHGCTMLYSTCTVRYLTLRGLEMRRKACSDQRVLPVHDLPSE